MHSKSRERIDDAAAIQQLGPEILRGRNRIGWKVKSDLGQSLFSQILMAIILPVVGPFVFLAVGLGFFEEVILRRKPFQQMAGNFQTFAIAYLVLAFVFLVALVGEMIWKPRRPVLTLHADGFRYDLKPIRFDELSGICHGVPRFAITKAFLRFGAFVGMIKGAIAEMPSNPDPQSIMSLTLYFKGGDVWPLPKVLFRIEPADAEKFMAFVREQHPELMDPLLN